MSDAKENERGVQVEATEPAAPSGTEPAGDPRAWRETLAAGRFEAAVRERTLAVGTGTEPENAEEAAAVRALADVQGLLRDKAWSRATRRVRDLTARPPLVDWAALEADLERIREAGAALDRRDVDAALAALEGTEVGPGAPEAEHAALLGTALVLDGRDREAVGHFERALEIDPRHHRVLVNLGNVALEDGRVDEAIAFYERALTYEEGFANAHHNLGVAYRRKGEIGKSVRALRRAQQADRGRERDEARESVAGLSRRVRNARTVRWLLWAAVAAVVVWVLMTRG